MFLKVRYKFGECLETNLNLVMAYANNKSKLLIYLPLNLIIQNSIMIYLSESQVQCRLLSV